MTGYAVEELLRGVKIGRRAAELLSRIEDARAELDRAEQRFGEGTFEDERERLDELEEDVRRLAGD